MQNTNSNPSNNSVLIIGGGIGGIRATMDLAEAGRDVILIDKASAIGGLVTQLDRTFPTNNCDLCTISPHLSETGRQRHIKMMAMTQLVKVSGEAGNFNVTLSQTPRHIDLEKCTACGDCYREFPECVRFSPGLDHRAPTCMRYPQATPHAYSIDLQKCRDVQALTQVCRAGAIIPDESQTTRDVNVGAIILSPGAAVFDPAKLDNFSYGLHPDVVTSLEYERILSASGPTGGELVRPSNGEQF
jgi:heterodisulfide reductase subunit A2